MKRILFLIAIVITIVSCKKDKPAPSPEPPPAPTTIIKYSEITPTASIVTVRQKTYDWSGCTSPVPADSSASIELDIDQDNIADFRATTGHTLTFGPGCNHCSYYTLITITILALHADAAIVSHVNFHRPSEVYLKGDSISHNYASSSFAGLYTYRCNGTPEVNGTYCGIKVKGKMGWIFLKQADYASLTIPCFAINMGTSGVIIAGQKS